MMDEPLSKPAAPTTRPPLQLEQCRDCGHLRVRGGRCRVCLPDDPVLAELAPEQRGAGGQGVVFGWRRRLFLRVRARWASR